MLLYLYYAYHLYDVLIVYLKGMTYHLNEVGICMASCFDALFVDVLSNLLMFVPSPRVSIIGFL